MRALPADQWIGSRDNVIIAQVDISADEIAALGGLIEHRDVDLGDLQVAVFELETGAVMSLSRTEGNPVSGYALILQGTDSSGNPRPVPQRGGARAVPGYH